MIVIDRIEDDIAYLEVAGEMMEFPVSELPENAKEGDILGFVLMDHSEITKKGQERLDRMSAASGLGDSFDL